MLDPVDPTASAEPPPAVVPPRGLAGLLDDYDPKATFDTSEYSPGQVFLNVYDVGGDERIRQINLLSTANNNLLLGGVFHGAIEVYGSEWSYGSTEEHRSGVRSLLPRSDDKHSYRTTVPLGRTALCEPEVESILERLSEEWIGSEYHMIDRNCLTFCNVLCAELGVGRIPGWVDRAQRLASGAYQTAKLARDFSFEVVNSMPEVSNAMPEVPAVDTEDAQRMAAEAVETLRSESLKALEAVSVQTQELAEATQTQAQVLSEVVQANAQVFGARASQLLGDEFPVAAQELGERTQEQARALGSSLWQWGQDLQRVATRALQEDPAPQGRAGDLWDTALLGGLLGGSSEPSRRPDLARRREARKRRKERSQPGQDAWGHSELLERAPVPEVLASSGGAPQAAADSEDPLRAAPPAPAAVAESAEAAPAPGAGTGSEAPTAPPPPTPAAQPVPAASVRPQGGGAEDATTAAEDEQE